MAGRNPDAPEFDTSIVDEILRDNPVQAVLRDNPAFQALLARRMHEGRPSLVIPRQRAEYVPVTFILDGKAGDTLPIHLNHYYAPFKPDELLAIDTSVKGPGRGTYITSVYVGALYVPFENVPTWMFSEYPTPEERAVWQDAAQYIGTSDETALHRSMAARLRLAQAKMKMTWPTAHTGITITMQVRFEETCRFEGALWGQRLVS